MPSRFTHRLGIVPYLNVLPLLEGLGEFFPESNWVRATPRELAGLLAQGEIDLATLPIFEALKNNEYSAVSGCAIGSDGPVRSVQLFSRKPLKEIGRVLLDRSSLTSVHLAQILCADHLKISPVFQLSAEPIASDFDLAGSQFDAAVVIGDAALDWVGRYPHALDLGAGWKEMTGLPFVFAAWVARPGVEITAAMQMAFKSARRLGERNTYEIAKREAEHFGRSVREAVDYLSTAVRYKLDDNESQAIEAFRLRLIKHGFLPPENRPLNIVTHAGDSNPMIGARR